MATVENQSTQLGVVYWMKKVKPMRTAVSNLPHLWKYSKTCKRCVQESRTNEEKHNNNIQFVNHTIKEK